MPSSDACIICAINSDNLQHYRIAEQNGLKAVLDIFPIAEGHVLILSRSHASHLEQLSAEEHAELFQFAHQIGKKMFEVLEDVSDYTLVVNNGRDAGQHIPHVHIHLIPRRKGDNLRFYWRLMTRFINPISPLSAKTRLAQMHLRWINAG
ncbi:HIT family protein [Vibrio cidicii]|uniref:Diadenosine tetraphosphate hydrolase n=1 Tax=Vibrio cidicii TaxID=1763883 RepID=A0A151JDT6_9VIBR|nr:HIT family protein [Vibrio cidicii]KYN23816.1 diadenosine tetraphosphate hydrolase [Vibrio cidicii]